MIDNWKKDCKWHPSNRTSLPTSLFFSCILFSPSVFVSYCLLHLIHPLSFICLSLIISLISVFLLYLILSLSLIFLTLVLLYLIFPVCLLYVCLSFFLLHRIFSLCLPLSLSLYLTFCSPYSLSFLLYLSSDDTNFISVNGSRLTLVNRSDVRTNG